MRKQGVLYMDCLKAQTCVLSGDTTQKPQKNTKVYFLATLAVGAAALAGGSHYRTSPLPMAVGQSQRCGESMPICGFLPRKSDIRGGISPRPSHVGENYKMVINV